MKTVQSKDGTTIAFDQSGHGTPLILVGGALSVRAHPNVWDLSAQLATDFTVISYDRRGRGDSGDTQPYAVQREVEDIEALIDHAGGRAYLYGMSSGAVLALEAANALGDKVAKIVMYEPPFIVDDSRPPVPADYVEQLNAAVAAGDPGGAVEIFMTKAILIPPEYLEMMKVAPPPAPDGSMQPPPWEEMVAVGHTLPYDGMIMGGAMSGKPLPANRWTSVTAPLLVITGGKSEPFFHAGAKALIPLLPDARHAVLEGQDHAVSPAALAPMLKDFFAS